MASLFRFVVAAGALAATCGFARASAAQENLHVAVACGEYPITTAEGGLHVSLDGAPLHGTTRYATGVYVTPNGHLHVATAPSEVAFFADSGLHKLHIDADDCAAIERAVTIGAMPVYVTGRLAIDTPLLRGPSGTPDGFDLAFGAFVSTLPSAMRSGTETQGSSYQVHYTTDGGTSPGFTFSGGRAHRFTTILAEQSFGFGTQRGVATSGSDSGHYWRHFVYSDTSLRIGARLPLHNFALSAGSGVALTIWSPGFSNGFTIPSPSSRPELTVDVPLWGMLDVKPGCDWGVRFTGTLNVNPVVQGETTFMTSAMLFYQPSSACSEPSGVQIGS